MDEELEEIAKQAELAVTRIEYTNLYYALEAEMDGDDIIYSTGGLWAYFYEFGCGSEHEEAIRKILEQPSRSSPRLTRMGGPLLRNMQIDLAQ